MSHLHRSPLVESAERVRRAVAALSICGIVAFFACQVAGCKTNASEAERLAWGDTLIDTSV